MLLVCKPIGRSGVLCCVAFRFAHEAPKTKEHLFRLGMDGAAFTRLCLITRAKLDDETAQLRRLASRGSQSRARAVSSQRRSWWSRVYEARSMDWWSHSPGRPSTLPTLPTLASLLITRRMIRIRQLESPE
jgi:hypothetical protein